jgi:hypothetical protein
MASSRAQATAGVALLWLVNAIVAVRALFA